MLVQLKYASDIQYLAVTSGLCVARDVSIFFKMRSSAYDVGSDRETSRLLIFMSRNPCVAGKSRRKIFNALAHCKLCFAAVLLLLHQVMLRRLKLLLARKFQLKGYSETL
jgi:hypothetical protein